jgi:aminopeptidase N
MTLSIVTPDYWSTVLSNQPAQSSAKFDAKIFKSCVALMQSSSPDLMETFLAKAGNSTTMTFFGITPLLPTYIFSFAAGPFQAIPSSSGTVPMSLYCVKSSLSTLKQYSTFIFDITQKTMAYYESFFGQKYAFAKYDQVFVR